MGNAEYMGDYLPGVLGFDPLGQDSPTMRAAEILNGRVAMIAITLFALEEAITKTGVVTNTPFLLPAALLGACAPSIHELYLMAAADEVLVGRWSPMSWECSCV